MRGEKGEEKNSVGGSSLGGGKLLPAAGKITITV